MDAQPAVAELLGIRLAVYEQQALLAALGERIARRQKTLVLSANVNALNLAWQHAWLRELYRRADIVRLDGAGVRLGARLYGQRLPPRATWADFIWSLAGWAEARGYRLFFLGGREGVAAAAADRLRVRHPALTIAGCHHGYFARNSGDGENEAVLAQIAAAQTDILLVGMGMPLQERWLDENWSRLAATVAMTGGAVFDYTSGRLRRAPALLTDNGLEWLGRMFIEPRRLWRRYLIGNPLFLWRVLRQKRR
jgi:N-acetylglucosaminyldiphosphoundecaprenol N-acetyl-beta-D-mannosaminyltransferase